MIKSVSLVIFCAVFLASCNSKPGENKTNADKNDTADKGPVSGNHNVDEIKNRDEELQAMVSLTTQDLEKLVPAELMGVSRTDLISNNNLGTTMVIATYAPENSAEMRLTIMDCGGAGGAGAYNLIYANQVGQDRDNDDEYSKTTDFNGVKAIEQCIKLTGDCSITWFSGSRYLVTLEGNKIETLKQAGKGLTIK